MRRPRFFQPESMYEVVVRTMRGRRLLRPTPQFAQGVYVTIARALQLYQVALHAFTYLSNHAHLLLSDAVGDQVAPFMAYVNRETSKLAQMQTGWNAPVWARYHPLAVLDDAASIERLDYVLANGVKEGLVASPLDWPGANSAKALVTGEPIEVTAQVRGQRRDRGEVETQTETLAIALAPIPCWRDLDIAERCARARAIVENVVERGRIERAGRKVLGVAGVLAADPFAPVDLPERDDRVKHAHAVDHRILREYRRDRDDYTDAYRAAAEKRRARADTEFPRGGYPTPPVFNTARDQET